MTSAVILPRSRKIGRITEKARFSTSAEIYSTLFHEAIHATGHPSRLARKTLIDMVKFGDTNYSKEELVAEMGAAFLCGHCGIAGKLQHAEYIGNWLTVLKGDKRAILVAAGAAADEGPVPFA